MADNKINMSLDDIIKNERANRSNTQGSSARGAPNRRFQFRRNIRGGRLGTARGGRAGNSRAITNRPPQRQSSLNTAATIQMVNKLVKRAISLRANQNLIRRAASFQRGRRTAVPGTRIAGFGARGGFRGGIRGGIRGGVRGRRGGLAVGSRLVGRLAGISPRSRAIVSGAVRRAQRQQQLVFTTPIRKLRGRGTSRLGRLVSDEPLDEQTELVEVVREVPRVQQPRRQIVVQRRPVFIERATYVPPMARRGGIQKRTIVQQQQRPRVVVVNRQRPAVQTFQPRTRFVTVGSSGFGRGGRQSFVGSRQKLFRMREAFGIGRPVQVVDRFEPSSSFLQRVPSSNRKGRGFRTERVFY